MKKTFSVFVFLLLTLGLSLTALASGNRPPKSQQILLVEVQNPNDSAATVTGLAIGGNGWQIELPPMPARVGGNGLAAQNSKQEGDGKSPSGQYLIGTAFGSAPALPAGSKLPYRQTTENDFWIDDASSPAYNTWVTGEKPTASHEKLLRPEYDYALVVEYNTSPITPGLGSAIFVHIWRDQNSPTAGCVALDKENLEKILVWLDPEKLPTIKLKRSK